MQDGRSYVQIEEVKDQIINLSLIFGTVIGFIAYFLSLSRFNETGFEISFATDLLVLILILCITLFRKKWRWKFISLHNR